MNATVTFSIPTSEYQGFCFTVSEILTELDLASVAATSVKETTKGTETKLTFELYTNQQAHNSGDTQADRADWWMGTIIDFCTIQKFNINAQ